MPAPTPFRYAERRPAAHLLPWVRNYWMLEVREGAPPLHHVPPDGSTALVLALTAGHGPGPVLSGPWLVPLAVPVTPGDRFVGLRLQPGALGPLLGLDPRALRNRSVPARPLLGSTADQLVTAFTEAATIDDVALRVRPVLVALAARATARDALVAVAVARLIETGGEQPIAGLAAMLGVSPRTLHRRFVRATGIAPKQFARIRRVLEAAWAITGDATNWGRAAHLAGYADQPHLHREVAGLTGLTPGELGARIRATEHDQVDP